MSKLKIHEDELNIYYMEIILNLSNDNKYFKLEPSVFEHIKDYNIPELNIGYEVKFHIKHKK